MLAHRSRSAQTGPPKCRARAAPGAGTRRPAKRRRGQARRSARFAAAQPTLRRARPDRACRERRRRVVTVGISLAVVTPAPGRSGSSATAPRAYRGRAGRLMTQRLGIIAARREATTGQHLVHRRHAPQDRGQSDTRLAPGSEPSRPACRLQRARRIFYQAVLHHLPGPHRQCVRA